MKRSASAAFGLVILALISIFFARSQGTSTHFDTVFGGLVALTSLLRTLVSRSYLNNPSHETSRYFRLHAGLVLTGALLWSFWICSLALQVGARHDIASLTMIMAAGIAASSVLSLGASTLLFRSFNVCLFSWTPILLYLRPDAYVIALAGTSVMYFFFLNRISTQISRSLILQYQVTQKAQETLQSILTILNNLPGLVSMVDSELRYVFMADRLRKTLHLGSQHESHLKPLGYGNEAEEFVSYVTSRHAVVTKE